MQNHRAKIINIGSGFALAFVALLLQPVAIAQSGEDTPEAVRACQRVPELSARLACYDRAFPPIVESVDRNENPEPPERRVSTSTEREDGAATVTESETVAEHDARATTATGAEPALATMVQIVEVEKPSLRTTRFVAVDGRVFVQSNATSIYRWPDVPFDVEIRRGRFGTTYLSFPESGLRIRVAIRD